MAPSQNQLSLEDLQRLQDRDSPQAARDPEAYFDELWRQFQRATKASSDARMSYFQIGPYRAKFIFACAELAENLTPPFLHLEIDPIDSPDLTIGFWDSQSSGIPLQPPRWSDLQGSRLSLHGPGTYIQFDFGTEILNALRTQDKTGLFWVKDAQYIFFSEKVCPARSIFHWLSENSSLQLIHGGAIGNDLGAAILVGRGGSGKSTSCSTALRSNLFFLGDDYCLLDTGDDPKVYSLYASTKINPDMLPNFPHLSENRLPTTDTSLEKPSFLVYKSFSERFLASLPLKAILMPRVTGLPETKISRASAMQGLHALAPSTLFQSTGLGDASLKKMAKLSRTLPCFHLELGTNLESIPRAVGALLSSL